MNFSVPCTVKLYILCLLYNKRMTVYKTNDELMTETLEWAYRQDEHFRIWYRTKLTIEQVTILYIRCILPFCCMHKNF